MPVQFTDRLISIYNRCPLRFQLEYKQPNDFLIMQIPQEMDSYIDQYLDITSIYEEQTLLLSDLKEDQWYRNQFVWSNQLTVCFPRVMRHDQTIAAYVIVYSFYPRLEIQSQLQCIYYVAKTQGYNIGELKIIYLNEDYVYNGKAYKPSFMFRMADYMSDRGGNAFTPIESILSLNWVKSRLKGMIELIDRPLLKPMKCPHSHFCPFKARCNSICRYNDQSPIPDKWKCDKRRLQAWLNQARYPYYFIDFEWTQLLMPWCKGQHFINDFVFEYALIKMDADGSTTSKIYITTGSSNKALFVSLIQRLGEEGTIFAFNAKGAEMMQLRRFATWYPLYHEKVCKILDRMLSIDVPLLGHMIYHEDRKGAYGLKQIASQIGFDGYTTLDLNDGLQAVQTYRHYIHHHDKSVRKSLEQYCFMDVSSMVALLKWYHHQAYMK